MVKYLRRLGHEVTVVTAAPPGQSPSTHAGVVRTASLNANPIVRRAFLRGSERAGGAATQRLAWGTMPAPLWKLIVPDPWLVTWNPAALRALRRLLRERRFDCVITSSPADSTHMLGFALGRDRPAWVADFRDGWCFEPLRPPFPTQAQRRLDAWIERRVATRADGVVSVTAPIVEYFRDYLDVNAALVTNGWDPELEPDRPDGDAAPGGSFTLVHTGALSGPRGRDPRPFLDALRGVIDVDRALVGRIQLIAAGRSEHDEQPLIDQAGLGEVVRLVGHVPREEALALQRSADALVLITSRDRCEATGKLYEYMAAGRPIIALAEGTEAARIIRETGVGVVTAQDDVSDIVAALRAALRGELERRYAPRHLDRYAYPGLAEQFAEVVEQAIERRQRVRLQTGGRPGAA